MKKRSAKYSARFAQDCARKEGLQHCRRAHPAARSVPRQHDKTTLATPALIKHDIAISQLHPALR